MSQLHRNAAILASSSIVAQGIAALTFWIVARNLGPSEIGFAFAAIGIATLFLTALDFGINSLTIRELAKDPDATHVFTETLSSKFVLSISVGAVWTLVTGSIALSSPAWWAIVPLGGFIVLSDATQSINVVARSGQRMSVVAMTSIVEKTATFFIVSVLFAIHSMSVMGYVFAMGVGVLLSALVAWRKLPKRFQRITATSPRNVLSLLQESKGFGLSSFASQIQKADVSIVASVAGSHAAGIFAAPARFTNILGFVPLALAGALFPRIASATDRTQARKEGLRAVGMIEVFLALPFAVLFILAEPIINIGLGESYGGSVPVLRLYLIGMVLATANGPLSSIIQAEGRENQVATYVGTSSIAGLLLVAIGAQTAGATGAAFGFVGLQASILICFLRDLSRHQEAPVAFGRTPSVIS